MAQMNRNVNLEEIDSDALFGIEALKNQTLMQKIVFFGSVILGVLANVLLPLYYQTPTILCIVIFMAFLLVGVAIGCNYTEVVICIISFSNQQSLWPMNLQRM